jgi:hypothetical protein
MALAMAHVLELPGKLRLSKDEYLVVQKIFYRASPSAARPSRLRSPC